eukprot:5320130-Pleurochrysis_carterae.AAC.2
MLHFMLHIQDRTERTFPPTLRDLAHTPLTLARIRPRSLSFSNAPTSPQNRVGGSLHSLRCPYSPDEANNTTPHLGTGYVRAPNLHLAQVELVAKGPAHGDERAGALARHALRRARAKMARVGWCVRRCYWQRDEKG